jgi:hypothetical protein
MESNWVHSALRPLIGLLCQPRVIMMMEKLVVWLAGETEVLGQKPASVPLCPPQTPHASRTRTRAAAVENQRLTAWATARPLSTISEVNKFHQQYLNKYVNIFQWLYLMNLFNLLP